MDTIKTLFVHKKNKDCFFKNVNSSLLKEAVLCHFKNILKASTNVLSNIRENILSWVDVKFFYILDPFTKSQNVFMRTTSRMNSEEPDVEQGKENKDRFKSQ